MKKKFPVAFCSLSLTLSSLLMRGLKLVGSLRKVMRSRSKKVFIPESRLCGECAVVCTKRNKRVGGVGIEEAGGGPEGIGAAGCWSCGVCVRCVCARAPRVLSSGLSSQRSHSKESKLSEVNHFHDYVHSVFTNMVDAK